MATELADLTDGQLAALTGWDARAERTRRAVDETLPHLEPISGRYRADPGALRRAVKRDPLTGEKLLRLVVSK